MTKILAEREVLSKALGFLKRYVPKTATIPVLTHVRIDAADNTVIATATDLDQSARISFPAEISEIGSFCAPAGLLRKMIDSASGSEVSISADDRSAEIVCGKQKFSVAILPGSDIPHLPMLDSDEGKAFLLDADVLKRVQRQVSFAVMDPRGAYFLTGVSWRSMAGTISFSATDKRRLSMLSAPCQEDFDIIVPVFDLPDWKGEVSIQASGLFIRLQCGEQIVASKLIEATYPDVKRLFVDGAKPLLFDRKEIASSIKRVALASDENHSSAMIVGRDGVATVSVDSPQRTATDELRYEGEDFQIAFDCTLILSVLQSFDSEMIEIGYVSHEDTATVRDPKDGTRSALAFPYRDSRLAQYVTRREAA